MSFLLEPLHTGALYQFNLYPNEFGIVLMTKPREGSVGQLWASQAAGFVDLLFRPFH